MIDESEVVTNSMNNTPVKTKFINFNNSRSGGFKNNNSNNKMFRKEYN